MIDRYSLPRLLEPRSLDFHLAPTAEGENASPSLFYELICGYAPRSAKMLYLGRVCEAESGRMLHELPYGTTDPKKMGLWWERTTGQRPPEALLSQEPTNPTKVFGKASGASVEAA